MNNYSYNTMDTQFVKVNSEINTRQKGDRRCLPGGQTLRKNKIFMYNYFHKKENGMISFEQALQLMIKNKSKVESLYSPEYEVIFDDYCLDCEEFYDFGYRIIDKITGKNLNIYDDENSSIIVRKKDGKILKEQWYFPGSDYWNAIHNGQKIQIPKNYKSRIKKKNIITRLLFGI